MKILVVLRNIYGNEDGVEEEKFLSKSDCNVLSEAMLLKEQLQGTVTALLFAENVPESIQTLKKACSYGAEEGCLVGFQSFDFSQTELLAQVMAETIRKYFSEYEMILFGRIAYDGDAINIATQLSCYLNLPRIVYSKEMFVENNEIYSRKYSSPSEEMIYRVEGRVLIQSIREHGLIRQPKIADIIRTYHDLEIRKLCAEEIIPEIQTQDTGVHLIKKVKSQEKKEKKMILLNGANDRESAYNLLKILQKKGFRRI